MVENCPRAGKLALNDTEVLYMDDNLYIMQRTGFTSTGLSASADQPGLMYVLNNRGDNWNGRTVTTKFINASFQPVAWWSKTDLARPINQPTDRDGRGYAVYAVK